MPERERHGGAEQEFDARRAVGPAARPSPVDTVLALQRSAGNQAVAAAILARQPGPTDAGAPPAGGVGISAPEPAFDEALRDRRYEDAARALDALDPDARRARIDRMSTVELLRVARAAELADLPSLRDELAGKLREPQHAGRVATAEIEQDLDDALARSDWTGAFFALHRLPDALRTTRLATLGLEQLTSIHIAAITLPGEYAATRTVVEARRVAKLGEDYQAALAASDWPRAATLLNAYNDSDLEAKVRALTPAQLPPMETAASAASGRIGSRVHRTIRFVRNAPAPATPHAPEYAVTTPGTEAHHATVGGGDVRVRTGVQATIGSTTIPEGYEMEYSGADAGKTRWLQFIWREVYREEDWWPDYYLSDAITTTGGSYSLTTDHSRPNYNTDSAPGSATPFYESGGADLRGPTTTTMLDQPSAMAHIVKREFDRGADRITSRAHFSTYLVRDMQILYRVDLTVEWVFERATHYNPTTKAVTTPPRRQTVDSARTVAALDPRMRGRLVAQWPNFDYLP